MTATLAALRRAWAFARRVMRTGRTLATSRSLPRWLRILFVVGCVQVPFLPVDEIALALAVGIMAVFYRPALVAAWQGSKR